MKTISVFCVIIGLCMLCIPCELSSQYLSGYPMPLCIDKPVFAGRILLSDQVHIGYTTPTVSKNFDETEQWGKDGVMSCGHYDKHLVLTAWRPDTQTPGMFQVAEKTIRVPSSWGHYFIIGKVRLDNNEILAIPRFNTTDAIGTSILVTIVSIFLFIVAYAIYRIS